MKTNVYDGIATVCWRSVDCLRSMVAGDDQPFPPILAPSGHEHSHQPTLSTLHETLPTITLAMQWCHSLPCSYSDSFTALGCGTKVDSLDIKTQCVSLLSVLLALYVDSLDKMESSANGEGGKGKVTS